MIAKANSPACRCHVESLAHTHVSTSAVPSRHIYTASRAMLVLWNICPRSMHCAVYSALVVLFCVVCFARSLAHRTHTISRYACNVPVLVYDYATQVRLRTAANTTMQTVSSHKACSSPICLFCPGLFLFLRLFRKPTRSPAECDRPSDYSYAISNVFFTLP